MFALLATAQLSCATISGSEALIRPGAVILLGEVHGTEESPKIVSKLACLALEQDLGVDVALEIPIDEREHVARYLAGGSRADLVASQFWSRDYQDGRSSAAILELLTALRALSQTGDVGVFLIDDPDAPGGRDRFMAAQLTEIVRASADRVVVALTGNMHNRLTVGTRFDPRYEPMGLLLSREMSERARTMVSLRITYSGGSAWVCTGGSPADCGPRDLTGEAAPVGLELFAHADDEPRPFSGRWHVGTITASPPAHAAGAAGHRGR